MTAAGEDADDGTGVAEPADSHVCVHGLGHIGLPTAAVLAAAGYDVAGYDVDETVLDAV